MAWIAVLAMGVIFGLLGGGGGILAVSILAGFFGLPGEQATGASLFIAGVGGVVGATTGLVKREVELSVALKFAFAAVVGSFSARHWIVPSMPVEILGKPKGQVLLLASGVLMLIVAFRTLMPPKPKEEPVKPQSPWFAATLGLVIGLISGLLGAGGGFLIIPALTFTMGIGFKRAIPTSLLVVAIQALGGFIGELNHPIRWDILLPVTGVTLLGMAVGILLREKAPERQLKVGFALVVIGVGIWMIAKNL